MTLCTPNNYNYLLQVRPDTVVHIWKSGSDEMAKVTKMGLQVIISTPWYLNYISYGSDWQTYYKYEPLSFNGKETCNPDQIIFCIHKSP